MGKFNTDAGIQEKIKLVMVDLMELVMVPCPFSSSKGRFLLHMISQEVAGLLMGGPWLPGNRAIITAALPTVAIPLQSLAGGTKRTERIGKPLTFKRAIQTWATSILSFQGVKARDSSPRFMENSLYTCVHSSITHKSQKIETTQPNIQMATG